MILPTHDRRTILLVDGEPEDQGAIIEAARATGGDGSRLLVLFVPVSMADWAHLELGDDPLLLRRQIECQQLRQTMRMLDEAGVDDTYRTKHLSSRWRMGELDTALAQCEVLIVSTSSWMVGRRVARLARRRRVSCSLVRGPALLGSAET